MVKLILVNAGNYGSHEPTNLLILAAYAKEKGHKVAIADQVSGENVYKKIEKLNPDFVGITGTTAIIGEAYKIADWCRKKNFKVIIGGVHVTVMPEEGLKHADYIVKGEGEEALIKILEGKTKEKIVCGKFIKNLDNIPIIDRNLINVRYYQKCKERNPGSHLHFVPKNTRVNSIFSTRGCPYRCIFCHNSWRGLPVRMNSAERIIEEMKELKQKYRTQAVFFMDDDFLFSKKRVEDFCGLYKKEKLDIIWGCQARVDSSGLNIETLKEMSSANCKQITFGFESGSQRILSLLKNDRTTLEQNQEAIRLVRETGILATGSFMIGNPTETEEEINETYNFIKKNNLIAGVGITTPYPGTKLWEMCMQKGAIPNIIDWSKFDFHNLTFVLNNIPKEKMDALYKKFLDLALEKNPGMTPLALLKSSLKRPKKAFERIFTNPHSALILLKRIINKNESKEY